MKKRCLTVVIAILLCLSMLPFGTYVYAFRSLDGASDEASDQAYYQVNGYGGINAFAAEPESSDDPTIWGTYSFGLDVGDIFGGDGSFDMVYSDSWFFNDSYRYNNGLAISTIGLIVSSMESLVDGEYQVGGDQGIRSHLVNTLKYNSFKSYNYGKQDTIDTIATAVAKKTIKSPSGETKTVVVACNRGGNYGAGGWAGNFNVGVRDAADPTTKYHEGFYKAALDMVAHIKDYVSEYNLNSKETTFWLCGYSRGSATANLASMLLRQEGFALSRNMYTYGIGVPANYQFDEGEESDPENDNIYNIINPSDLVPMVPPEIWNFGLQGTTIRFTTLNEDNFDAFNETFTRVTGSAYTLNYDYSAEYNTLFGTLGKYLSTREIYASILQEVAIEMLTGETDAEKYATINKILSCDGTKSFQIQNILSLIESISTDGFNVTTLISGITTILSGINTAKKYWTNEAKSATDPDYIKTANRYAKFLSNIYDLLNDVIRYVMANSNTPEGKVVEMLKSTLGGEGPDLGVMAHHMPKMYYSRIATPEDCNIRIKGDTVDTFICNDILGDATMSYTRETNMLTLKDCRLNASYEADVDVSLIEYTGSSDETLHIELFGENEISCSVNSVDSVAVIKSVGGLIFSGSGSLKIVITGSAENSSVGILSEGDVSVSDCEILVYAGGITGNGATSTCAISTGGSLYLNDSVIEAYGGEASNAVTASAVRSIGIEVGDYIYSTDTLVTAVGGNGINSANFESRGILCGGAISATGESITARSGNSTGNADASSVSVGIEMMSAGALFDDMTLDVASGNAVKESVGIKYAVDMTVFTTTKGDVSKVKSGNAERSYAILSTGEGSVLTMIEVDLEALAGEGSVESYGIKADRILLFDHTLKVGGNTKAVSTVPELVSNGFIVKSGDSKAVAEANNWTGVDGHSYYNDKYVSLHLHNYMSWVSIMNDKGTVDRYESKCTNCNDTVKLYDVSGSIESIRSDVEVLKNTVGKDYSEDIAGILNDVKDLGDELQRLNAADSGIMGQISAIKADLEEISGELDGLNSSDSTVMGQISAIRSEIEALATAIRNMDASGDDPQPAAPFLGCSSETGTVGIILSVVLAFVAMGVIIAARKRKEKTRD